VHIRALKWVSPLLTAKSAMEREREYERAWLQGCCWVPAAESFVGEVFRLPGQPAPSFCYRIYIASWPLLPCALIELEPRIHNLCELMFSRQTVFDDSYK